jgi:ATP-dependent RNA helicase DDX27
MAILSFLQFQPTKQRKSKNLDFEPGFKFVSSVAEYNHDTWDDIAKYVKRKAKNRLDERIQQKRRKLKNSVVTPDGTVEVKEEEDNIEEAGEISDHESDICLSDDDLKRGNNSTTNLLLKSLIWICSDTIKERVKKNKKKDDAQEEFFEDAPSTEEHTSFYQMNLSRPLLKVNKLF